MASDLKDPLKLLALDADDLSIMSAHMQDSLARIADMAFLPAEHRFAMLIDRFDWIAALGAADGTAAQPQRRRAGLHFDRVQKARTRGFDLKERDKTLNLLAVEFTESDAPAGVVTLIFSGDAAIQLDVECLEAAISDLGPAQAEAERRRHGEG
jgi:hypothetical protein